MELTHIDEKGAKMVDVGAKDVTTRTARAKGEVAVSPETVDLLINGKTPKGDVFNTARTAGIFAAKKTAELIPMCHNVPLDCVSVDFTLSDCAVEITAEATAVYKTGVDIEALTSVSGAALTVYDMLKAVDKYMTIGEIRLVYKAGGKSGVFERS